MCLMCLAGWVPRTSGVEMKPGRPDGRPHETIASDGRTWSWDPTEFNSIGRMTPSQRFYKTIKDIVLWCVVWGGGKQQITDKWSKIVESSQAFWVFHHLTFYDVVVVGGGVVVVVAAVAVAVGWRILNWETLCVDHAGECLSASRSSLMSRTRDEHVLLVSSGRAYLQENSIGWLFWATSFDAYLPFIVADLYPSDWIPNVQLRTTCPNHWSLTFDNNTGATSPSHTKAGVRHWCQTLAVWFAHYGSTLEISGAQGPVGCHAAWTDE